MATHWCTIEIYAIKGCCNILLIFLRSNQPISTSCFTCIRCLVKLLVITKPGHCTNNLILVKFDNSTLKISSGASMVKQERHRGRFMTGNVTHSLPVVISNTIYVHICFFVLIYKINMITINKTKIITSIIMEAWYGSMKIL